MLNEFQILEQIKGNLIMVLFLKIMLSTRAAHSDYSLGAPIKPDTALQEQTC